MTLTERPLAFRIFAAFLVLSIVLLVTGQTESPTYKERTAP